MRGTKIVSRSRALVVAGVVIATGIAMWSAPSDARRSHVFGHNFHSFRHGLHSFRQGVHLPSLHSSYPCSVLGHRPCIPYGTYCSVFSHHPCLPDIDYPIGETLQLTIASGADSDTPYAPAEKNAAGRLPRDLNTIRDVFTALRTCWVPPERDVARTGTQITLRLSFNSHGGMISEPRTTYVTPDTPPDVRQIYWDAATPHLSGAHRYNSRMGSVALWPGVPSQFGSSMIGLFNLFGGGVCWARGPPDPAALTKAG